MSLPGLPSEILLSIVGYLSELRSSLLSLNLVCHRLNSVTETYLYKQLSIKPHYASWNDQRPKSCTTVLDALEKRPDRYALVESLHIQLFKSYREKFFTSVYTLLNRSVNVKSLAVDCDLHTLLHSDVSPLLNSKKIHHLELADVSIEELTQPGILQDLRSLVITGEIETSSNVACEDDRDEDDDPWWKDYELPVQCRGISPMEDLTVTFDDELHPCTALPILSWAAALKTLTIDFVAHSNIAVAESFTSTQLQDILNVHSATLEIISLSAHTPVSVPDFSHFTSLRELYLSLHEFFDRFEEEAARELAAPRLASITIDFDVEDQQNCILAEFEDSHYKWLKSFGEAYRSIIPEGGLERIEVVNVGQIDNDDFDNDYEVLNATKRALEILHINFVFLEEVAAVEDRDVGAVCNDSAGNGSENEAERGGESEEEEITVIFSPAI